MEFHHTSVLLNETIDNLNIKPNGIYVDGTLGGGGHALEVAKRLGEGGRLIGIDQDADAILAATERLKEYQDRVTIVRSNYCNMRQELKNLGIEKVDGIVLDLGVSSFQLAWFYLYGSKCSTGYADGSKGKPYGKRYCQYLQ